MFYVYRHIRLDSNKPFYVGKGQGIRAHRFGCRNKRWLNIAKKFNYKVEIVRYFNDENEALEFEKTLIKLYKSYNLCEANLVDGGKGSSGWKVSEETREKIRQTLLGAKVSEETKAKLRLKRAGKKPTLGMTRSLESNLKTSLSMAKFKWITPKGEYHCARIAATHNEMNSKTLYRWCKQNKNGFKLIKL